MAKKVNQMIRDLFIEINTAQGLRRGAGSERKQKIQDPLLSLPSIGI